MEEGDAWSSSVAGTEERRGVLEGNFKNWRRTRSGH